MVKIGYHIRLGNLGQVDEDVKAQVKSVDAAFHLVTTAPHKGINSQAEIDLVDEWAKTVSPARIVWRTYSSLEGDWAMFPSNEEIIKRWLAEDRPDYIRDDPAYEPHLSASDPAGNSRYVKSRTDLLHKATAAGIKVAVGAFSVGTPHTDLISNGIYDDLIRAVIEGEHYFSVHEACPGIPGAGDVFPYEVLLEPQNILKQMRDVTWGMNQDYKLLRHSDLLVLRARELGLKDPKIIITESFIDLIPNAVDALDQLHDKYGIPAYNKDLRGVLAWRMYYADAFPNKSFSEVVTQLCKYIEETVYYPDYIVGICLHSLDWDKDVPDGHNFLNPFLDDFRKNGLPNLNGSVSITTPPPSKEPSAADTVSTRSPEYWKKVQEIIMSSKASEGEDEMESETAHDLPERDISEDSTVDGIPAIQDTTENGHAGDSSPRASSTVEVPRAIASNSLSTRWQKGVFSAEDLRVRIAPFTDAEPIGLLTGELTGEQHIGDIQSDGYTWRWIRYVQQGEIIEGYVASAFYEFKPN